MKPIINLGLIVLVSMASAVKAADEPTTPSYIQYRSDLVQQEYSKALVGFAFEHTCDFLNESMQAEYEQHLNFATEVFKGYLLANKMVQEPDKTSSYVKDMVLGSMRYAKASPCDAAAKERTALGFDTAKQFLPLIDGELQKEASQ